MHFSHKPYRMDFQKPSPFKAFGEAVREGFLIRAEDDFGRVAYGEVAPLPFFGTETPAQAGAVLAAMNGELDLRQVPMGCPATQFGLSSVRHSLEHPNRDSFGPMDLAALLPPGPEAIDVLRQKRDVGFSTYKWKVGVLPYEAEVDVLDALLDLLPGSAKLRLDANGGLTPALFDRWIAKLKGAPIEFFEQPLASDYLDLMLDFDQDGPLPLALDESATILEQCRVLADRGWSGFLVIKPSTLGVFEDFLAWRPTFPGDCIYSSAFETPIGMQAAFTLASLDTTSTRRALGFGTLDFLTQYQQRTFNTGSTFGWLDAEILEAVWTQA